MKDIPMQLVEELLSYDPETGSLKWKSGRFKGREAGQISGRRYKEGIGHRAIVIRNHGLFMAHRVCWALFYGEQPIGTIDHINGIPSDNRIANLRIASIAENNRNRGVNKNNLLGVKGVHKTGKRFKVQICKDRKTYYIGRFDNLEDAKSAYADYANKLHGEFARSSWQP